MMSLLCYVTVILISLTELKLVTSSDSIQTPLIGRNNHIVDERWKKISRGGAVILAAATVPPPDPSASFRGINQSYRGNEDVPIISGHSLHRRKSNRRKRQRRSRRSDHTSKRRRDETYYDTDGIDSEDGLPPFFVGDSDSDGGRMNYERQRSRRRRSQTRSNGDWQGAKSPSEGKGLLDIAAPFDAFRRWAFDKTGFRIPRVLIHFDPITILKIRKSWHDVVPGAIVRVGADFATQRRFGGGIWRLRGCLEDKWIGGRVTLKEKMNGDRGLLMEYSKSWLFAGVGSLATRFKVCATYDLKSRCGSARFGFRTENMDVIGKNGITTGIIGGMGRQGFTLVPILPIDGPDGHLKLEAKTNFDLPEPELVVGMDLDGFSMDVGSLGMGIGGDIDVEIEELNLICEF